jgi:hypothetical protein
MSDYDILPAMAGENSKLRQRLAQAGEEHQRQIEHLLEQRGPLIHGSLGKRKRVCGKPTCRCARGELHEQTYLSSTVDGQTHQVHIPAADKDRVESGVGRYRTALRARKRLRKLSQLELKLAAELIRSLFEPYPPEDPLPLPRRRAAKDGGSPR